MDDKMPWDGVDERAPTFTVEDSPQFDSGPKPNAFWGQSDSGKTYSAMRFMRGLLGPNERFAVVDTENKRAKVYAKMFQPWSHIDFQPPFTPERYIAAHDLAVAKGCKGIIFDSMSHVWEGEGGVLDQAEAVSTNGLGKWKKPKMAYKRMCLALWRSPVHTVFLLRAKEKFVQIGKGKDATIESRGLIPICGADFIFEMHMAVHLENGTHVPLAPIKIPAGMPAVFEPGVLISEESGKRYAKWLSGGVEIDQAAEALKHTARQMASKGSTALRDWWASNVRKKDRPHLDAIMPELKALMDQADAEQAQSLATAREAIQATNGAGSALDDKFTNGADDGDKLDGELPL